MYAVRSELRNKACADLYLAKVVVINSMSDHKQRNLAQESPARWLSAWTYDAEPLEVVAVLDVFLREVEGRVVADERVPVAVVVVRHHVHKVQIPEHRTPINARYRATRRPPVTAYCTTGVTHTY